MKKYYTLCALAISIMFFFSAAFAEKVTILHVNDTHSNLTSGGPRKVDLTADIGGIAKLATVVGMTKMEDTAAVLLHAGDVSIGDILYCKNFAVPELQFLSAMGFNAVTLGNHEFDLGPDVLTQILTAGAVNPSMKLLCANGNFDAVPALKSLISSSTTVMANGVKVGIFGVTTPEVMYLSNPSPVYFNDTLEVVANLIAEEVTALKMSGCQVVVMLSHLGHYADTLCARIPGINLIVGGHDHFYLPEPEEYTNLLGGLCYVVQQGAFLEYAGKIEFDVHGDTVDFKKYTSIHLDESIPEEPTAAAAVAALVADAEQTYGPVFSQKIATISETFEEFQTNLADSGKHDTPVGNLVSDAFRAWGGTDIGLTASGFTSHPLYKGSVNGNDIYRMMGYGFNTDNGLGFRMIRVGIKGNDLAMGIQWGLLNILFNDDYLIQCSGMTYDYALMYDPYHPDESYGGLISIKVNDEPMDTGKVYTITTHEGFVSFLELLGIPYNVLSVPKDTTEFMVVQDYIFNQQLLSPYQPGRVQNVTTVGVKEETLKPVIANYSASPNPCKDETNISFNINNEGLYTFEIYNQQLKLISSSSPEMFISGSNTKNVQTNNLPNGFYIFVLKNANSRIVGSFIVAK